MRRKLLELRDRRLFEGFGQGKTSIGDDRVFPSAERSVLDPDNLIKRYFLPCIEHAGPAPFPLARPAPYLWKFAYYGTTISYVKEQMGHSSIQITVDTYGHLIPGGNFAWVDRLDSETTLHQSAPEMHKRENEAERELAQVVEEIGGGGWTRTIAGD